MVGNLDTALIRTFITVADKASMTAAAATLHLTQGAVSQQVRRLEDVLGASLFERDRRGLRLTAAGERLFGRARQILALNDEIWAEMTGDVERGKVRLGVPFDLVGKGIAPVLKSYNAAFSQVELSLICAASPDLKNALAAGEIDIALIEEPVRDQPGGECLRIERLVWVGAKGGTARARRPLPVSMVSQTCAFRPVVFEALETRNLPWRTVFESGNIEATAVTVRTDMAVTAWLAATVPDDLAIITDDRELPPLPAFSINMYWAQESAAPAIRALANHMRNHLFGGDGRRS
ncbi:LysR family transcriptional regulator [Thalassospira mesophila]|uniref:LysR family transcriptional regulator n=1 Tax=Thalassospira mesophila TaxID=1293891 RepID=A0A1Y2L117_9PROT|nr:LysR family transcriptional regulator [Thalassospira mesophila]OSQ38795.1 LysR family transcriptional regulator [Thalassospira mesophila]